MFSDNTYSKELKQELYQFAKEQSIKTHGISDIFPCGNREFDNCFTDNDGEILFWYSIPIESGLTTSMVSKHLKDS